MSLQIAQVGQIVKAVRDIPLVNNVHVTVLSSAAPQLLPSGTEAEVTAVEPHHIDLNCKDGQGHGAAAWGLKIRVAKTLWGISFQ